jgi:hypothetical protein
LVFTKITKSNHNYTRKNNFFDNNLVGPMLTIIGQYYLEKWIGENEQPIIIKKQASTMKE